MSTKFQKVMRDVAATLKSVYNAHSAVLLPGSGTFAMEAAARHFGAKRKCLVIRNGYFSYRWSQIFEAGSLPAKEIVLKARPVERGSMPMYAPPPLEEVIAAIEDECPNTVFAPHVETSSGIMLPDEYIQAVAEAVHNIGGLLVLDCIASGCIWVDMQRLGVDVLISAPQKGWSGPASSGIVLLSKLARAHLDSSSTDSFALDLRKWAAVMEAYQNGGHMYHTTMPTDAITRFRDVQQELAAYGFERARREQLELGDMVRNMLKRHGYKSVAADGFAAPGVVVAYTQDPDLKSGAKFAALGIQIAAGVPLMVDHFTQSAAFQTFRLGLFGIDKLRSIPSTAAQLERAICEIHDATTPVATSARL
ncbi:AGXT [Symbiodinium pilosum]|uniref:alanine--glyoxylate transaminase n=1 Tax=Symbiodinium pilosum TaxID=2952 RepID=A0A812J8S8_SYMPI|nr:AGXT [Symbiodinium pilosum]